MKFGLGDKVRVLDFEGVGVERLQTLKTLNLIGKIATIVHIDKGDWLPLLISFEGVDCLSNGGERINHPTDSCLWVNESDIESAGIGRDKRIDEMTKEDYVRAFQNMKFTRF